MARILFIASCLVASALSWAADGWVAGLEGAGKAHRAARYAEAERLFRQVLADQESEFGTTHPHLAVTLTRLASALSDQARYSEAEEALWRAITIIEKARGPDYIDVATALAELALVYDAQDRFTDAWLLLSRAASIQRKAPGSSHLALADTYAKTGAVQLRAGDYESAERSLRGAMQIFAAATQLNPEWRVRAARSLAELHMQLGRYSEAEKFYKTSIAAMDSSLAATHPEVGEAISGLARLYEKEGSPETEAHYRRVVSIQEAARGADHPRVAQALDDLAKFLASSGRRAEAELLLLRSMGIKEGAHGSEHTSIAGTLGLIAELHEARGRYAEAEPLRRRELVMRRKVQSWEHVKVIDVLHALALGHEALGRLSDAEALNKEALEIREARLGRSHPKVALSLIGLARVYRKQGRFEQASALARRSIEISEKSEELDQMNAAPALAELAAVHSAQGNHGEANRVLERALAILESGLGADHPAVSRVLGQIAEVSLARGNLEHALKAARRASRIQRGRMAVAGGAPSEDVVQEQKTYADYYAAHVRFLGDAAALSLGGEATLAAESFEIAQLARASETAGAIAGMAARFAKGDDELARLAKAYQETLQRLRAAEREMMEEIAKPPRAKTPGRQSGLREAIAALAERSSSLDQELARKFPEYRGLTRPEPLELPAAQRLLRRNEALVSYLVARDSSYLWVVRQDRARFLRLDIGKTELDRIVQGLRRGVDVNAGRIPKFDVSAAYDLYVRIFQPAEVLLEGVTHVHLVTDGALQSLPFGVLVTKSRSAPESFAEYRDVDWLAKRYAFTVLPSEGSLQALRRFTKAARGVKPFVGFGDPLLAGQGEHRGTGNALLARSAVANVDEVRRLERLPETADELAAVGRSLRAPRDAIHLRDLATETRVKKMDLIPFRVVMFATHGLMSGDFKELAEPALVLTPPAAGTEVDDGLLTAGEIAQLRLNADWVVLSACNTAAADGSPGAEGLSGLAKAFFFAGARAILVSHWPVESTATVQLTTHMFRLRAQDPSIGKAMALQRSMLAVMSNPATPRNAHPMFWAPFVVVGEGGDSATR